MKMILLAAVFGAFFCSGNTKPKQDAGTVKNFASYSADPVNYDTQVLPILQKKCSPCHFEGGKMYAKMPFDNSTTITSHETGVLKRFKDEQEIALIKQFIKENSLAK